jgi:hypothetical protein
VYERAAARARMPNPPVCSVGKGANLLRLRQGVRNGQMTMITTVIAIIATAIIDLLLL